MNQRSRYKKKTNVTVVAVRLNLDTEGFTYRKWGAMQTCKPGDWLVENRGDTYTVDDESFKQTYREVSPGVYLKHAEIWAEIADHDGVVRTKEGETHYKSGDYLVTNPNDPDDRYAVVKHVFEEHYEPM
ncbi:MAG: hypothetical protein ABW076_00760 [Candidatus Thiodiazotropha sp.]